MSSFTSCRTTFKTQYSRKLGKIRKISKLHRIITQCPVFPQNSKYFSHQQRTAEKQKLTLCHIMLFHMKTKVCLIYFVHDCSFFWFFSCFSTKDIYQTKVALKQTFDKSCIQAFLKHHFFFSSSLKRRPILFCNLNKNETSQIFFSNTKNRQRLVFLAFQKV